MSELDIPPDADDREAADLLRELVSPGDEVSVDRDVTSFEGADTSRGTVVSIAKEHLELETGAASNERIRPSEIGQVTVVSRSHERP